MVSLAVIAGLSWLIMQPLSQAFFVFEIKNRVLRKVAELQSEEANAPYMDVRNVHVAYRGEVLHLFVTIITTQGVDPDIQENLDGFRRQLEKEIDEPVLIMLDVVPVNFEVLRSAPDTDGSN